MHLYIGLLVVYKVSVVFLVLVLRAIVSFLFRSILVTHKRLRDDGDGKTALVNWQLYRRAPCQQAVAAPLLIAHRIFVQLCFQSVPFQVSFDGIQHSLLGVQEGLSVPKLVVVYMTEAGPVFFNVLDCALQITQMAFC